VRISTVHWNVFRPVNRDSVWVTAFRYVDTFGNGDVVDTWTEAMTGDGVWNRVEDGVAVVPTIEISGRAMYQGVDEVANRIRELCETAWTSLLEERSDGEVQS
jgi:hypothetical protein